MRVLYILHTTQMDGSTISFLNMVEGLIGKGVYVEVAGPDLNTNLQQKFESLGVKYHKIRIAESIYPSKDIRYFFRILNLLRRKSSSFSDLIHVVDCVKPEIIHTNSGVIQEGCDVAKKLKLPHVWHLREYQDKDFSWTVFPSRSIFIKKLHQSYVISITDSIRHYFSLTNSINARTIYNGVGNREKRYEILPKDNYFLCSSRISREKGFDDLIMAFSLFYNKFPNFRLIILGDGDEKYIQHLKDLSVETGCLNAIDWLGFKTDVFPYMQKATALIVASLFEGFGRMTAEACFAGCLVIGRNSGGTKEILSETGGFLFNNNQEMFQSMCDVVSLSTEEYKEKAILAQQKAKQLYSIEGNVEEIYKFYQDILSNEQKS